MVGKHADRGRDGLVRSSGLFTLTTFHHTSGAVKLQDFFYAIGSVSQSSPEGLELAWGFYQESFPKLKSMLAKASPSLMDAAIIYSVAG